MSFTNVFGGDTLFPADLSYRAVTLSASTTLQWPTEASAGTNLVAAIMDVTATAGSLSLTMPPATEVSTGTAVVFNNVGGTTFTVLDNGGSTLLTVASGLIWTLYLTDNSTAAGSWKTYQNGAGTSSASAASLAGYGLKAITTTLNQTMPVTSVSTDFTADATYRAGVWVWTGGAGTVSLTAPATLGNDWFFNIKNSGTGSIVLTPLSGSIDGETTVTLTPDESAIVVTDGTDFFTIGLTPIPTPGFDYTAIAVAGSGNYTLAGTEIGRISYSFTGALTGVRTIVIPATIQQYWVSNDTTGSTTGFFVKTSSQAGSGVSVPPGMSRLIRCDGNSAIDAASNPILPQLPTSSGTNTITVAIPTAPSQYVAGFQASFVAGDTNTGASTLNVNSLGAVAIQKRGAALASSDITQSNVVVCYYDGTQFQMVTPTIALNKAQTWTALQTFSSGISFGGTTLSTYAEGTFTPVASFGGTAATSNIALGSYTRVGDLVFVQMQINCTNKNGGTGQLVISQLPFTAENTENAAMSLRAADNVNASNWSANVNPNTATIQFFVNPTTSAGAVATFTGGLTNTTFGAITVGGCYKV